MGGGGEGLCLDILIFLFEVTNEPITGGAYKQQSTV